MSLRDNTTLVHQLLQVLDEKCEILHRGRSQFSTVYLLHSAAGFSIAHILASEYGPVTKNPEAFLAAIGKLDQQDRSSIRIAKSGSLPEGSLYWVSTSFQETLSTLQSRSDQGIRSDAEQTAQIGVRLCVSLAAMHARGIFHGGLTPSAIVLAGDEVLLTETGVYTVLRQMPTSLAGLQPHYFSPEQLAERRLTNRSDIYSLGAVLYELLTGKPPFGGRTTTMTMASILTDETTPVGSSGGQEPGQIVTAILRAIEKDPADRWNSTEEFGTALREAAASHPHRHTTSPSSRLGCLGTPVLALLSSYLLCRVIQTVYLA